MLGFVYLVQNCGFFILPILAYAKYNKVLLFFIMTTMLENNFNSNKIIIIILIMIIIIISAYVVRPFHTIIRPTFMNLYCCCFFFVQVDLKCSTAAEGPTYYRECLAKVGEIRQRPNRLEVGDRVSVCLEADVVQAMAQGHGGWQSSMADVSNARIYPTLRPVSNVELYMCRI